MLLYIIIVGFFVIPCTCIWFGCHLHDAYGLTSATSIFAVFFCTLFYPITIIIFLYLIVCALKTGFKEDWPKIFPPKEVEKLDPLDVDAWSTEILTQLKNGESLEKINQKIKKGQL